ncbi:A-kinase anchor protein 8, partial [Calypte anna]
GYEGYDYYNTQTTATNSAATYNYAAATSSSWETPKTSELSLNAEVGAASVPVASYGPETAANENSDSIIAKINQRLDMLSKEGSGGTGEGMEEQESSFRFESFDSYDSRSSLNDRELYRGGYEYGEVGAERGDSFGSHFESRRGQPRPRGN